MTSSASEAPPAAHRAGDDLSSRVVGAAQWRILSAVLQAALQFGLGVALARLLPPGDFGLAAMAAFVVAMASIVLDLGLGSAIVQRKPLTERHIRVGASLGPLLGALLAMVVLLTASWVGAVLGAEGLPAVLRAEAALFLFAGFGVTARALLRRNLQFRQVALVELSSYVFGYALVALVLALQGFGVWSLVAGALTQSFMSNAMAVALVRHPWRPLAAGREAAQLLRFGTVGALNGAVAQTAFHGDNLVVGRLLGTSALGLYGRAFSLMMLPLGYVGSTLFSVLFPALAELRDDQQRFARAYLLSVELVTLVSGPIMAGMAVAAPYLIGVLYGDAWIGAVVPFQVFCAVGTFRVLALPAGAVTHAAARIEAELRRQVVYAVWVIAGAALGAWWGGIAGAAVGVATGILYKYVAVGTLSLRIGGADWPRYLRAQAPGVALAAFVAMIATLTRWACEAAHLDDLTTLLSIIGTSAVAMVGGVYLLPDWLRPRDLFQHLSRAAARLPVPARLSIRWALRSHA